MKMRLTCDRADEAANLAVSPLTAKRYATERQHLLVSQPTERIPRLKATIKVLALILVATSAQLDAEPVIRVNRGVSPAVGTEATVGTGDVLFTEFERQEVEWARLRSDTRVAQTGLMMPKGTLLEGEFEGSGGKKEYCKGFETALYCMKDRDGDGSFDKLQILGGGRPPEHFSARYELIYQPTDEHGWRKELVYQGVTSGILRLTYREYTNDWTTPTVSQDLSYDISPTGPTEVIYQGTRLVFSSATSNSASYTVTSGFRKSGS